MLKKKQATLLELFAADHELPSEPARKVVDERGWAKLNFDSGCDTSVIPSARGPQLSAPSKKRFKTASGDILPDEGLGVLEGMNESGGRMRLSGRRATVGKPLIAASEMLKKRIGVLDESMGMVIEKNSDAGRAIMALVARLKRKGCLENDIRLHQERGVYNAYMKLPAAKAKELEEIPAHALQEVVTGGSSGAASSSGLLSSGGSRPARP